jgi:hypothetical protein
VRVAVVEAIGPIAREGGPTISVVLLVAAERPSETTRTTV